MLGGLLIIFAKFVFPKFAEFIIFNGTEIPHFAQMFMDTLNFVGTFWWLIILGIVAVIYVITLLFKVSEVKNCWDNFILKLPVISDFITYINLSNFMTVMYIAYEAGVPILTCLELANKTVGNNNIKTQIAKTSILVKTGKGLVESFGCTGAIPSALLSMLSAGEKSGTLGKMFKDCADVIDKRVDMALTTLSKLFEPTVMVILGISVLIIAIVFYQMYIGMLGTLF
jgi:type IV pilus assembly protein PilC